MSKDKIVKMWRGTRAAYSELCANNKLDYWTRYSVKGCDGTWIEYYGSNQITYPTGQLQPVKDIVDLSEQGTFQPQAGERYLMGIDKEYYLVSFCDGDDPNKYDDICYYTEPFREGMSVRVENEGYKSYYMGSDGLETFDYDVIDGGEY
jgi:hypothetical protein